MTLPDRDATPGDYDGGDDERPVAGKAIEHEASLAATDTPFAGSANASSAVRTMPDG
jgi:hypothetical protein